MGWLSCTAIAEQPDGVARGNWIQTDPDQGWVALLRLYSPMPVMSSRPTSSTATSGFSVLATPTASAPVSSQLKSMRPRLASACLTRLYTSSRAHWIGIARAEGTAARQPRAATADREAARRRAGSAGRGRRRLRPVGQHRRLRYRRCTARRRDGRAMSKDGRSAFGPSLPCAGLRAEPAARDCVPTRAHSPAV